MTQTLDRVIEFHHCEIDFVYKVRKGLREDLGVEVVKIWKVRSRVLFDYVIA